MLENGAKEVHSYITHGVMSGPAVERITSSVMKSLVITDSIAPTDAIKNAPNIRIVPTAPMFAQAILNIWNGTRVSSLFDADDAGADLRRHVFAQLAGQIAPAATTTIAARTIASAMT